MSSSIIRLRGVKHAYNRGTPIERKALDEIDLDIERGEKVGVIGPPGSGKTTLAMIMAGLETPTGGKIKTPGLGRGKAGFVFQFPEHQIFAPTVFEDITYALRELENSSKGHIEKIFSEVCQKVGLDPELVRDLRPSEMSGGERRRVAIAGILAMEPDILIFDEPTAGLDERGRRLLLEEIRKLSLEGRTVVIISHEIEDILFTSERIIFMKNGRITEDGTAGEVLESISGDESRWPMLPYVTELMVRLNEKGLDVRRNIIDADEAFDEIMKLLNKKRRGAFSSPLL